MAADTDYLFSWVLKHRVIASWSADEQAVSLDQETRIQWYLDVLLPHRNTLQSHGKVDYRDDLRVRIARLKNRTDFEAVLKNTFHSHETRIPNQKVALGYGMDSLDTEIWRAAVSAVRLKLIHQVRALAQRDASILRPVQGKTSILHVAAAYNAASLIRIFIEEFRFPADTEDERGQTPIEVALNFGSITAFLVLYHSSQWPEQLNLARIIFLNAIDGAAQTLTFIQRLHLTIQAQRKSKERSENKFKITKMTKKMRYVQVFFSIVLSRLAMTPPRVFFDHKKGVFVQGDPAIPDDFEDEWSQDDIGDVSTDRLLESNLATRNACFHTALIYANWDAFCCHLLLGVNVDLPGFSSSQVKVNLWYSHLIEGYNPDYHLGDLWYTPLQMAAWYNRPLMVAALLSAGADVHARGSQGRTALHMACGPMRSTERLEQWLEDSEERETVVSAAADESPPTKVTTIELLVDAGADIEARDALGFTPLMWAIEFDDFDTADFLLSLEDGANIDATDALSRSALIRACNRNDLKALQYCVRHKADLNLAEYASYTALAIAISDGDDEICKALIEAGADLCTLTDVGDNALQVALRTSHWSLVSLLLSHMESHCSEDEIRQILSHHDLVGLDATAICLIRPLCPEEIFEKIVELSAPWLATSTNFLGENALHIALLYPAFPTLSRIEALLNTGVDPNQLDDVLGWGPVHAAMFRFMVEEEQHYFAKISQLIIDNGGDADLPDHKRQLCASDILEFEATWSEDGGEVGNVSEKWKAHYRDIEEYLAERSRTRAQMGVAVPNNRTRDETKERFSRGGKHRSRRISRMRHSGCYCRLC
jgi:ankyrin repeat protein